MWLGNWGAVKSFPMLANTQTSQPKGKMLFLKEAFQQQQNDVTNEIALLKQKLDQVTEQTRVPQSTERKTLKQEFDAALKLQQAAVATKRELVAALTSKAAALRSTREQTRAQQLKLGFKSTADLDAHLDELKCLLSAGGVALLREKQIVEEISALNKVRSKVEALSANTGDKEKLEMDNIKALLKQSDDEIADLALKFTAKKQELADFDQKASVARAAMDALYEKKKALVAQLSEKRTEKSRIYTDFKAAQDAHFTAEKARYQARDAQRKKEAKDSRDAKLLASAEYELEQADIPAFGAEVNLIDGLHKFLSGLVGQADAPKSTEQIAAPVSFGDAVPSGATVMVSKHSKNEDFLVLGTKKSKKNTRKIDTKRQIKLDFDMIANFDKLKIACPLVLGDVASALAALTEAKAGFLEKQAAHTAINKEKAAKQVAKIKAQIQKEDEDELKQVVENENEAVEEGKVSEAAE